VNTSARRTALVAMALVVAAATHPASSAEPSPPPTVGPAEVFSTFAFGHEIITDRRGGTTLVWTRSVARPAVLAAHRPTGGDWGEWTRIGRGFSPQVGVESRGVVTALWQTPRDAVHSARLRRNGSWSAATQVSPAARPGEPGRLRGLDLAVSPGGAALAVWASTTGVKGSPRQLHWARRGSGGPWRTPADVAPPGHAAEPQVEMDADAVATLVHGVQRRGEPTAVVARRHVPGSGWTRARTLAPDGYPVELEVERAGDALVVFRPGSRRVDVVSRPADGRWRDARTLTPPGVRVDDFAAAMNGAGNAVVGWIRGNGDVEALRKDPGRPWSDPALVSPSDGGAAFVSASVGEDAGALVAWGYFGIEAAFQAPGSEWSEPVTVARDRDAVVEVLDTATGRDGGFVVVFKNEELAMRARDIVPAAARGFRTFAGSSRESGQRHP
jgi:hypothetical protein